MNYLQILLIFCRSLACYNEANDFVQRIRNVEPPIYNQSRLAELPVPSVENQISPSNSSIDDHENNDNRSVYDAENNSVIDDASTDDELCQNNACLKATSNIQCEHVTNCNHIAVLNEINNAVDATEETSQNSVDPLTNSVTENNTSNLTEHAHSDESYEIDISQHGEHSNNDGSSSLATDPLFIETVTPKTEQNIPLVPLYDIHVTNNDEIDELLDEPEEIFCDEEVIMKIGPSGMPKPWAATVDELIKRENDKMTGNIAFNQTVNLIFI